jgi:hypothetical protein
MHRPSAEDEEWSYAINASFDFDEDDFLRLLRRISVEERAFVPVQRLSARAGDVSRPEISIINGKA